MYEEEEYESDARRRSHENQFNRFFYLIVTSVWFNFIIFLCIIANALILAQYSYDMSQKSEDFSEFMNNIFNWIFFTEMILKIFGLGFYNYKKDSYNILDAIIVIISMIDWTIAQTDAEQSSFFKAFRAVRMLRMMKLTKIFKSLNVIWSKTV